MYCRNLRILHSLLRKELPSRTIPLPTSGLIGIHRSKSIKRIERATLESKRSNIVSKPRTSYLLIIELDLHKYFFVFTVAASLARDELLQPNLERQNKLSRARFSVAPRALLKT